jgi:hypothetical protein
MDAKLNLIGPRVIGRVALWHLDEIGQPTLITRRRNQLQLGWSHVVTKLLSGLSAYRIGAMYVEFENVANPLTPVATPSYDDTEGTEYYEDLALSADRDFLRVPLNQMPLLAPSSGYTEYFPEANTGNVATFYAQTQGVTGVHGKSFTNSNNSKIYGLALVAVPEWGDRTKDIVFARMYFDAGEQTVKPAATQLAVSWDVKFIIDSLGDI